MNHINTAKLAQCVQSRRHTCLGLALIAQVLLATPVFAAGAASVATCESLARIALPNATITSAVSVAAGTYTLPEEKWPESYGMSPTGRYQAKANPAFCRVIAVLKPSADSNIRTEIWLPESGWNGKFAGIGNFGWGGDLRYSGMLDSLVQGYATASNDTGHDKSGPDGDGGRFLLGHPEKMVDYAYRAVHEMTVDAKKLIQAYYGTKPSHAYFFGCSLGGLEGLVEAKRYPADYDGIVVGAPPNPLSKFNAAQLWPSWLISQNPERLIPKDKYDLIHKAAMHACASKIGLADDVLDEPDRCHFDPIVLQCKGPDAPDCLTGPQVELMQQIYAGPVNPKTKKVIFPGPARGSESELFMFANGKPFDNAIDLYRYAAFQNADWDASKMDWDKDVKAAEDIVGPFFTVDSDLRPFLKRGGKLLLYIGWNDYHNPLELIDYYKSLIKTAGPQSKNSVRLFTIPGMAHCGAGAGCDTFSKLGVIDAWTQSGKAPDRIVTAKVEKSRIVRTRPVCAYPKVAKYKGAGDTSDAANFVCALN